MFRSIRSRLQVWYAVVLLAVLLSFGGVLYAQIRQARLQEIDADLERAVQGLLAQRRGHGPPPRFDGEGPEGPEGRGSHRGRPPHGLPGPPDFLPRRPELPAWFLDRYEEADARPYFAIWHRDGALVYASGLPAETPVPQSDSAVPDRPEPPQFRQRGLLREIVLTGPGGNRVLVGRSIRAELGQLQRLAGWLMATGFGVLGVGLFGGWLISKRALLPIAAMSATAESISASSLSQRIDTAQTDRELRQLGEVLNAMFARLEKAFQRQIRFTADASHELRTPVSIILADTELALSRDRTVEECRETIETCYRAARRMRSLVDALLTLARIDSGELVLRHELFDVTSLAADCVALLRPLAAQKCVRLEFNGAPATMVGDPERVAQVITNLLTNAVNYNREGGEVRLSVAQDSEGAVLTVSDTGFGIPPEDQPHIFERFYRVDKARSRELGGSGLGLAICQTIVQTHGGTITLTSQPDEGTSFVVRFP